MSEQNNNPSTWTPADIAHVLKTAELLNQKGSAQKLNVAALCEEIGISRKNAYKHKKHHEHVQSDTQKQRQALAAQHNSDVEKIRLLEERLEQADLHEKLRLVMRELIIDLQKKDLGSRPKRQKLIEKCNQLSTFLGQKPLF
jgi:ABC-type Fe3+/spermidine/putrescine transport system ATPase subunit